MCSYSREAVEGWGGEGELKLRRLQFAVLE